MSKQEPTPLTPEQEAIHRHVDVFVQHQRQKQSKLEEEHKRNNRTLNELIAKAPPLSKEAIDAFFVQDKEYVAPQVIVDEVKKTFEEMRTRINRFNTKKRFFILETMDLFTSKISIAKLIPALLMMEGTDQKKAICEFIRPTFTSINKNVETLVSTNELFDPKNIHLDRGSLYTLLSDLANILLRLFRQDYLDQFPNIASPVELLLKVIQAGSPCLSPNQKKPVYEEMVDDRDQLRNTILHFVYKLQSHEALLNYAIKRHNYYKLFLVQLTKRNRIRGVDPLVVSKIFAGCLVANNQLKPDEALIEAMIHPELYNSPTTLHARRQFIDKLAPSAVYKLITHIRVCLQHFSKINLAREFHQVETLSAKNFLKKIWTGFIRFIEKGAVTVAKPIVVVFEQLQKTFDQFLEDEKQQEGAVQKNLPNKPLSTPKKDLEVQKNKDSLRVIQNRYKLVETDIVAFRGEYDGASQKDAGYNARIFHQDELVIIRFLHCFERLFKALEKNDTVRIIHYKSQRDITEYYAAFSYKDKLVTIGITHQKSSTSTIQEKDMFPYILLFKKDDEKAFGRILSREVLDEDETVIIFNEESMTNNNAVHFYESIYHILHLLPEKDWKSKDGQMCIKFILEELKKLKDRKVEPIFLETFPV